MEPLVSICTTTYNHASYLENTLNRFLSQKTDFPYEILVHDDCSTDGTVEILRRYAEEFPEIVKPLYEERNQYSQNIPINETFNFPRARGKYIALCEGDDCWTDDGKLQAQADYMEAHPDCTFCFTNGVIEDQTGARPPRDFIPYYEKERPFFHAADHRYDLGETVMLSFVPTASFFFPKAVLEAMPPAFHEKMCQHGDLKMRLFFTAAGYGYYLHRYTCLYRENVPGSAFAVWCREAAAQTAARAATVSEMLADVNAFSGGKYDAQIGQMRDHYLYVELWNTEDRHILRRAEMRRVYRGLPLERRAVWRMKRVLPRSLFDGVKRRLGR